MATGYSPSGDLENRQKAENKSVLHSFANQQSINRHGRAQSLERNQLGATSYVRRKPSEQPRRDLQQNKHPRGYSVDRSTNHENHSQVMHNKGGSCRNFSDFQSHRQEPPRQGRAQYLERNQLGATSYVRRKPSEQPRRDLQQNKHPQGYSVDRSSNHENHSQVVHNKGGSCRNFSDFQSCRQEPPGPLLSLSQSSGIGIRPPLPRDSSHPFCQPLSGFRPAHRGNNPQYSRESKFGYNRLKLLTRKNSDEIVIELTNQRIEFYDFLKETLSPDKVMLLAEVLAKMTSSTMLENKTALFTNVFQPNVLGMLSSHSSDISTKNLNYSNAAIISYFQSLAIFYKDCIAILPNSAIDYLKEHLQKTMMSLSGLKMFKQIHVSEELQLSFEDLLSTLTSLESAGKSSAPKRIKRKVNIEWKPPGTNFREVSTFPLPQDVLLKSEVELHPVVVEGPYENVEHYLNVQFNLLREDFIIPLRDGVMNFIEQKSAKNKKFKVENVRFYQNVQFLSQSVEGDTLVSEVLFDPNGKYKKMNWKASKKFKYGSLVCFSSDSFSSLFLGVIVNSDVKLLAQGILQCELIGEVQEKNLFGKKFIMAENEAYFEAYHHVLDALKNFNENNFPFKRYIINVATDVALPAYLNLNMNAWYDFNGHDFQVINKSTWPSKFHLKVNDSQFEALYSALTQELVVIQGPPGTGKTYLGLVIARVLLDNKRFWRRKESGPILVVCYTNHALDQFLEGILNFTANIVRVGGQSRNEKMAAFNLKTKRRDRSTSSLLYEIEQELRSCAAEVNELNFALKECKKGAGIISLRHLVSHMNDHHSSWFQNKDSLLVEWLLEGAFENDDYNEEEFSLPSREFEYAITLEQLAYYISYQDSEIKNSFGDDLEYMYHMRQTYVNRFHFCKKKLKKIYDLENDLITQLNQIHNLSHLRHDHRWILYNYWLSKVIEEYDVQMEESRLEYQSIMKRKSEINDCLSLKAMSEAAVVGITTTGAARQQALLQKLGARVVIVEEAAEVLESHVLVSLSDKCEHLILIGDHKQLRPKLTVYKLGMEYNFDISFFERMLKNNLPFNTLNIQHRMRPEIADLIIPAIYPTLKNHETVLSYDSILGIEKNLFFIMHTNREEQVEMCLSKRNLEEAKFLIALCRHIILQGYDPSQITILTFYLGQKFVLGEERDQHAILENVKIACVDDFQGEENDIILLSLVRSNDEGKIGFVGSENRICVALSRAKKGLYVMGNMELLASKSSLWKKVYEVLEKKGAIGSKLKLKCVKHPEQLTEVCKKEDFIPITEGGCTLMCNSKLNCGHICKKICHMNSHDNYLCHEICGKTMCSYNHKCKRFCFSSCGDCMVPLLSELPCGHWANLPCCQDPSEYKCKEIVEVKLPECGHEMKKECHQEVKQLSCAWNCDSRLPCGHVCEKKCHVTNDPDHLEYKCLRPCARTNLNCKEQHICQKKCFEECSHCTYKVKRKLPGCDHYYDMECSEDASLIICKKSCKKMLACKHKCPLKCFESCGGCEVKVEKTIEECKHKIQVKCCIVPERKLCKEKCERLLSCGHKCEGLCGSPCTSQKCKVLLEKSVLSPCEHEVRLFCHERHFVTGSESSSLLERCYEPCSKMLECNHMCKGTCGSCQQGRIHIQCQEKCGKNLICGHECKVSCSQSCPPCKEPCFIQCEHSKCRKKCGNPCVPCKEKCSWSCKHYKCTRLCGQMCDRTPCDEPCEKKLKCGHPCMGFCGEKCPPLCRLCDAEQVEEISAFLPSDDDNPRFVFLPDCKHMFDAKGLDQWFLMATDSIKMIVCPQCTTPIQNAKRYGNVMKQHFRDVLKVKTKVFGELKKHRKEVSELYKNFRYTCQKDPKVFLLLEPFLEAMSNKVNQKTPLNAFEINSLMARIQIARLVVQSHQKVSNILDENKREKCIQDATFLIQIILRNLEFISPQEHSDISSECMRFQLKMQLCALQSTQRFKLQSNVPWRGTYDECAAIITSLKPFQQNLYQEIFQKLDDLYKTMQGPIGITKLEMKNIVNAIDLHQGHWYTCPNGHVYVIADCGRAVMESSCNECGARIGGGGHRHLVTNTRLSNVPEGL